MEFRPYSEQTESLLLSVGLSYEIYTDIVKAGYRYHHLSKTDNDRECCIIYDRFCYLVAKVDIKFVKEAVRKLARQVREGVFSEDWFEWQVINYSIETAITLYETFFDLHKKGFAMVLREMDKIHTIRANKSAMLRQIKDDVAYRPGNVGYENTAAHFLSLKDA